MLSTALPSEAQATSGIRRCVKGSASGVDANHSNAQNRAKIAAASQIIRYLRNGYQVDPGSIERYCFNRGGVFVCKHSLLACKYRHDN